MGIGAGDFQLRRQIINAPVKVMATTTNQDTMRSELCSGIDSVAENITRLEGFQQTGEMGFWQMEPALLEVREELITAQRRIKEMAAQLEQCLIAHIDKWGDIEIANDQRLYVGSVKVTKAIDDSKVFDCVRNAAGNTEVFQSGENGVLVAQPWKTGAVKKLVGIEIFDECFSVEIVKDIKTGAAKRTVKVFDPEYSGRG